MTVFKKATPHVAKSDDGKVVTWIQDSQEDFSVSYHIGLLGIPIGGYWSRKRDIQGGELVASLWPPQPGEDVWLPTRAATEQDISGQPLTATEVEIVMREVEAALTVLGIRHKWDGAYRPPVCKPPTGAE